MTGYADMNLNNANTLGRRLQSRFHEQGYGTLADKTRARVLTDRAEKKRNMPAQKKTTRASAKKTTREESVMDAIMKTSGRRIEVKTLQVKETPKNYRKKTSLPLGMIMMVVVFGMVLAFVVHSSVRINEANSELTDLQRSVALQNAELRAIELELETKNDLRVIEDIAINQLGMTKKENIDREYISLNDEDSVVLEEDDATQEGGGGSLLSAFATDLKKLAEYFK